MRKRLRTLALLTCITSAAAVGGQMALADTGKPCDGSEAGSGQRHEHKRHDGHRHFKKMARELDLTDQQKTQAKALWETNRANNKPLFGALMSEKRQLRTLVHSGSADEAAIRSQASKVAAAEADLAVKRAQGFKEFRALLTPDQLTKLKAMQAKREAKMKDFTSCEESAKE